MEQALAYPDAMPSLASKGLDADAVRRIAHVEASHASPAGISALTPEQLAEATGLPAPVVRKARLALVELGLQDIVADARVNGDIERELHHE